MKLVVKDVPPWDGDYTFDIAAFTNRDGDRIRVVSGQNGGTGVRAGELVDALDANDTAAFVGFAVVVLGKHGHDVDPVHLWEAPIGSLKIDLGDDPPVPLGIGDTGGGSSENEPSSLPDSENGSAS